jgi:hypothetical protein
MNATDRVQLCLRPLRLQNCWHQPVGISGVLESKRGYEIVGSSLWEYLVSFSVREATKLLAAACGNIWCLGV